MPDYLLLMHDDAPADAMAAREDEWPAYLQRLRDAGVFQGGSSIGGGDCLSRSRPAPGITPHLSGYVKVNADTIEAATALVAGNPVFEAGGTVEIRELPRD